MIAKLLHLCYVLVVNNLLQSCKWSTQSVGISIHSHNNTYTIVPSACSFQQLV